MCKYRLIYLLCLYVKNTPEIPKGSLQTLMPTNAGNSTNTPNREEYNDQIQYMNDSPNTNPISFTTGVYNQKPVTYKHPYTLFLPSIYTRLRYANKKYCLFYINLSFALNDYTWEDDELNNMSINLLFI